MSLHLVSVTEIHVRACVVDATDEEDAMLTAARLPADAWRVVHSASPLREAQALDGVPRAEVDPS